MSETSPTTSQRGHLRIPLETTDGMLTTRTESALQDTNRLQSVLNVIVVGGNSWALRIVTTGCDAYKKLDQSTGYDTYIERVGVQKPNSQVGSAKAQKLAIRTKQASVWETLYELRAYVIVKQVKPRSPTFLTVTADHESTVHLHINALRDGVFDFRDLIGVVLIAV